MQTNHIIVPNEIIFEQVCGLLEEGKHVTIKVGGNSMLPFIRGGRDTVVIVRAEDFGSGDIVLAKVRGASVSYVIHRVLAVNETEKTVLLMGDGNLVGTETCPIENVKGKIVCINHPDGSKTDCNSPGERRKAQIWRKLRPIRRYLLPVYKKLHAIR